jgi:hypothetical protein
LYEKDVLRYEITDEVKLIRAALNNQAKKIPPSIIRVDEKALLALIKEKPYTPSQWKSKGVKVWTEKVPVVRT